MKWSTNFGSWYDTPSCWKVANNVTDLLIRKNYLQKINKTRKQVKKMMAKQATMGMWSQRSQNEKNRKRQLLTFIQKSLFVSFWITSKKFLLTFCHSIKCRNTLIESIPKCTFAYLCNNRLGNLQILFQHLSPSQFRELKHTNTYTHTHTHTNTHTQSLQCDCKHTSSIL